MWGEGSLFQRTLLFRGQEDRGCWDSLTESWVYPLLKRAYTKRDTRRFAEGLINDEMPDIDPIEDPRLIFQKFLSLWHEKYLQEVKMDGNKVEEKTFETINTQGYSKKSMKRAIWEVIGKSWRRGFIYLVVASLLQLTLPLMLGFLVNVVSDAQSYSSSDSKESLFLKGMAWVLLLFVSQLVQLVCYTKALKFSQLVGLRLRFLVAMAVQHKALRISYNCHKPVGIGQMVTLVNVDAAAMLKTMFSIMQGLVAPLLIIIVVIFGSLVMGYTFSIGLLVVIIFLPLLFPIMIKAKKYQRLAILCSEERISHTNTMVSNNKMYKFFSWEKIIYTVIATSRRIEGIHLRKFHIGLKIAMPMAFCIPVIATVITFIIYSKIHGNIPDAATAFQVVALFKIIALPFLMLYVLFFFKF